MLQRRLLAPRVARGRARDPVEGTVGAEKHLNNLLLRSIVSWIFVFGGLGLGLC